MCTVLLQERGWQAILGALQRAEIEGILPGPARTEAIWVARRKGNQSAPVQISEALTALGLRVEHPTEDDLVRAAELIEISHDNPGPPPASPSRAFGRSRPTVGRPSLVDVKGLEPLTSRV